MFHNHDRLIRQEKLQSSWNTSTFSTIFLHKLGFDFFHQNLTGGLHTCDGSFNRRILFVVKETNTCQSQNLQGLLLFAPIYLGILSLVLIWTLEIGKNPGKLSQTISPVFHSRYSSQQTTLSSTTKVSIKNFAPAWKESSGEFFILTTASNSW